jgi:hypothetical protein
METPMSEKNHEMDLLFAMRDLGVAEPLPGDAGDVRARAALGREIDRMSRLGSSRRWARWIRRGGHRAVLMPAALLLTTAAAAAATGIATGVLNPFQVAHDNAIDAPLRLFENNPGVTGATPAALWHQTVIPSTVRRVETFTVPGVGLIQYWVADTEQHGICTALRLPGGTWAGLQHNGQVGGSMPGCRPTRAQVSGGALGLDGFDYQDSAVIDNNGKPWLLTYGVVTARGDATQVRDTVSGTTAPVVEGQYFALAVRPVGEDWGDDIHLKAFDASGRTIAPTCWVHCGASGSNRR